MNGDECGMNGLGMRKKNTQKRSKKNRIIRDKQNAEDREEKRKKKEVYKTSSQRA